MSPDRPEPDPTEADPTEPGATEARQRDASGSDPQVGAADPAGPRRRRGYRRATGGTAAPAAPAGAETGSGARGGLTGGRAPDDTDLGWNEPTRDDDERILREKPPHW